MELVFRNVRLPPVVIKGYFVKPDNSESLPHFAYHLVHEFKNMPAKSLPNWFVSVYDTFVAEVDKLYSYSGFEMFPTHFEFTSFTAVEEYSGYTEKVYKKPNFGRLFALSNELSTETPLTESIPYDDKHSPLVLLCLLFCVMACSLLKDPNSTDYDLWLEGILQDLVGILHIDDECIGNVSLEDLGLTTDRLTRLYLFGKKHNQLRKGLLVGIAKLIATREPNPWFYPLAIVAQAMSFALYLPLENVPKMYSVSNARVG